MKPPVSSRLTTPRQIISKKKSFNSSKDLTNKARDSIKGDPVSDNDFESNSIYLFKSERKLGSGLSTKNQNLRPSRFGSRSPSPAPSRELSAEKNVKTSKNSKRLHWQTSSTNGTLNRRPSTSVQKETAPVINEDLQIVNQNFLKEVPKSSLFLNYAKLVAIESNIQKELVKESEYITRPKTANPSSYNAISSEENNTNHILTSMNLVDSLSVGNQEAYKYLMFDSKNKLEAITYTNNDNMPMITDES